MKTLFTLIILLIASQLFAQNTNKGTITVAVTSGKTPVENATLEILKDGKLVKAAVTDKSGLAEFERIPYGEYALQVSAINFAIAKSSFTLSSATLTLPGIELNRVAGELGNVNVVAKKPFIQRLQDRLIVNVDNSIVNAGSTAFEVLERSPGVSIDANDIISLRGRQGVTIMMDGKITPMAGADLANFLRGLPSNAIESIHLITNPSAKYDASGNSGIIDIKMKKDQRFGVNGTLTAGYGQGVYPKTNSGLTLNYRNKKVNIFGNYNYAYRVGLNHLFLDRNFFTNNGVFTGQDVKDNYAKYPFSSNTARFGADYFPSKNTIVGFVVNGSFNHINRNTDNKVKVMDRNKLPLSTFKTLASNNDHNNNFVANVNFRHTFDTLGKELTADADYGKYNSHSLSTNATNYYNLNGTQLQPAYRLDGDQDGIISIKTAKADYVNPMPHGMKFETGVKTSLVSSDNNAVFTDLSSGSPVNDVNKTNRFFYKEWNNAAYANFSKEYRKFNFQLGLRAERTDVKTEQVIGNVKFDTTYTQLFPSAFFNYKLSDEKTLGMSVSRRIDRPNYSQLNPFIFLIDVTTYATGNTALLPQLTWSYELSYTVKSLNFTLGYSHTKNSQNIAITRFKDAFPNIPSADNVTVQIPINLEGYDYYGLTVAAPIKVNKWWNMVNNANAYYGKYIGSLGSTHLNEGRPSFEITSNNSFTLPKNWSAELNAVYNSSGQYGFMVSKPQWGLSAGAQKSLWNRKATVRLNVTDIFRTNLPGGTITYNNYLEKWNAIRESRVATVTFTYRFGNNKVQAARRRTTASEEETRRAG